MTAAACHLLVQVELPEILSDWLPGAAPQATGWEADVKGKLLPRCVRVTHRASHISGWAATPHAEY